MAKGTPSELRSADLEEATADGAICHPELAAELAEAVAAEDFDDLYLASVFAAALAVASDGGGYGRVHAELLGRGVHRTDADVVRLYALRGDEQRLFAADPVVVAGGVRAEAARRRLRNVLVVALDGLDRDLPDRVEARLREQLRRVA